MGEENGGLRAWWKSKCMPLSKIIMATPVWPTRVKKSFRSGAVNYNCLNGAFAVSPYKSFY